ncbi:MAG: hypothetical protein LBK41_09785 [Clostridiales bacterium]|nr:hypothetical protein [Clostridiales bacterium]
MTERTWRYSGVQGDEDYVVSCDDCEGNSESRKHRCENCVHNSKSAGTENSFFPFNSCGYCSDGWCSYRHWYPC